MAFTAQITASFFLAAAVAAAPTDAVSMGASSVSFHRQPATATTAATWHPDTVNDQDYYDQDEYDNGYGQRRLMRRDNYQPANYRARSDSVTSVLSVSSTSSESDFDYAAHVDSRPAFSRQPPSIDQLNYEIREARQSAPYGRRLMRRSYSDDSDSDDSDSDDSDSYGQDYRQSLRRHPNNDYGYGSRLQRRGEGRRGRRGRRAYDSDSNSDSDSDAGYGYGRPVGAPRYTPNADDYYRGVSNSGSYGRLVRRAPRRNKSRSKSRGRKSDTSDTDTSSDSSSENDSDRSRPNKGSGSDKDNDSDNDYKSDKEDNDDKSDNDYKSDKDDKSDEDNGYGSGNNSGPDYGNTQPDYGNAQPDYGNTQPDYGNAQPDYGNGNDGYGQAPSQDYGGNNQSNDYRRPSTDYAAGEDRY